MRLKIIILVTFSLLVLTGDYVALPSKGLAKRMAHESPSSGCLTVRGSGTVTGECPSLTSALTVLGSSTTEACIFVYNGTYKEAVTTNYEGKLTIYGYTTKSVSFLNHRGFLSKPNKC